MNVQLAKAPVTTKSTLGFVKVQPAEKGLPSHQEPRSD